MPSPCFADILEFFDDNGELCRIEDPIDPKDPLRDIKTETNGRDVALLANVLGRRFPMVGQIMVDEERIAQSVAMPGIGDLTHHIKKLVERAVVEGVSLGSVSLPAAGDASAPLASVLGPQVFVKQASAQQVVRLAEDLDLTILPALRVDKNEVEEKITAATLLTLDPDSNRQLAAAVDFIVESPTRLVPCWKPQNHLDEIRARYVELKRPMPVAILSGGNPMVRLVAAAPKPYPIDPSLVQASLWKQPVEVVACRTLDNLVVPADTDLVIEGLWMPAENAVKIQAVTHQINPIVPFALPKERPILRRTLLAAMLPWWRAELPGLADMRIPSWSKEEKILLVSIQKTHVDHADRIADSLVTHPVWSDVRQVVLLDESVRLTSTSEVLVALLEHGNFAQKAILALKP